MESRRIAKYEIMAKSYGTWTNFSRIKGVFKEICFSPIILIQNFNYCIFYQIVWQVSL